MGGRQPWWPVAALLLSLSQIHLREGRRASYGVITPAALDTRDSLRYSLLFPARVLAGDSVPRHLPVSQQAQDMKGGFRDLPTTHALLRCTRHVPSAFQKWVVLFCARQALLPVLEHTFL